MGSFDIQSILNQAYSKGRPSSRSTPDTYLDVAGNIATGQAQQGQDILGGGLATAKKSTDYWSGLLGWMRERLLEEGMVSAADLDLIQVVDTVEEVCAIATGGAPR